MSLPRADLEIEIVLPVAWRCRLGIRRGAAREHRLQSDHCDEYLQKSGCHCAHEQRLLRNHTDAAAASRRAARSPSTEHVNANNTNAKPTHDMNLGGTMVQAL